MRWFVNPCFENGELIAVLVAETGQINERIKEVRDAEDNL